MKLEKILSSRERSKDPWNDVIYEWEDVIADYFSVPIVPRLSSPVPKGSLTLSFSLSPFRDARFNIAGFSSFVVDFYLRSDEDLRKFYEGLSHNPLVFISSAEAFEFLRAKGCPLPIRHVALSLSDRYRISASTRFDKDLDLVVIGRPNAVLLDYIRRYEQEHPDFVWVRREYWRLKTNGEHYTHFVSSRGEDLGFADDRVSYFNLLKRARSTIYSTPGIDDSRKKSNGFNQVTPRFLEYLCCGCHVLSRYTLNPDTEYYEFPKLMPHLETYEQFREALERALTEDVDMKKYSEYLNKHYTSVRCAELKRILEES